MFDTGGVVFGTTIYKVDRLLWFPGGTEDRAIQHEFKFVLLGE